MIKNCCNCLNAYNSPFHLLPQCWNKEWLNEGLFLDNSVRSNECCGTWQRRKDNQPILKFRNFLQLDLFDDLINS